MINTICAGRGAFGYLREKGERHDLGQGDNTELGSLKLGADGPATPAWPTAASAATAK